LLVGDSSYGERAVSHLLDSPLRRCCPAEIQTTAGQTDRVPAQTEHVPQVECAAEPDQQRDGIERVDDEYTAEAERRIGEWQPELGAVNRHPFQNRMSDQHQPEREPPPPEQLELALQLRDQQRESGREQSEVEERVALRTMKRHVAQWIAVIDEGIEIGQSPGNSAPHRRFPHGHAPTHHGDADRRTQRSL